MPTGYTAKLYEGEEQTFEEFALTIARAFSHIELRDTPLGPIPTILKKPDTTWRDRDIARAEKVIDEVSKMSVEEATKRANDEADEYHAKRISENEERKAREDRYRAMLKQVVAWTPPTERHEGLKKYMIEQLNQSIDFDCKEYSYPDPTRDGEEWKEKQLESARTSLVRATEGRAEEIQRTNDNNLWAKQLFESLGLTVEEETE
jgi:hypothetical protein